jgi:hypothetical protein
MFIDMRCFWLTIAIFFSYHATLLAPFMFYAALNDHMLDVYIPVIYYVDSNNGDDQDDGLSDKSAWRSLDRLQQANFNPGDTIMFKRGSQFSGTLYVDYSGTPDKPIVLTSYGDTVFPAPAFTNPYIDKDLNIFGNCIRIRGSHIIVEHLYFHHTVAELPSDVGSFLVMWELGAIYIDKGAEYCVVRHNEIYDCGVGIKSYGEHAIIEFNYIHDCSRVLKEWGWGPIGIWLGADNQVVRFNRIYNYRAIDPRITWGPDSYGGGADGSAIEIDDARFEKTNIRIHHNHTQGNQGFLEVTWTDVKQHPKYENFWIHHNVSDDYQQFLALWRGAHFRIEHNTIIRRRVNVNDWGVFNITQPNSRNLIRNNIIVVENDVVIYNLGRLKRARPQTIIENNLYYAASGYLNIGLEGPGVSPVFGDPGFLSYHPDIGEDDTVLDPLSFSLTLSSPAIDRGADLGYNHDFAGTFIPQGVTPDLGAFEFIQDLDISNSGKAMMTIRIGLEPSIVELFAAEELSKYLSLISDGAYRITIEPAAPGEASIFLSITGSGHEDAYAIYSCNQNINIQGNSDRALLYGVYDFLERLGCIWLAPDLIYYNGYAEYIPQNADLVFPAYSQINETPVFSYRKLDAAEGRSLNIEHLRKIIDWMPKVRKNVLMVPADMDLRGRTAWSNYRELLPEIQQRGLLLEVGQHGYQNFLNARMDDGKLFENHPEWFGKDSDCMPGSSDELVFNIENDEAVDFFIRNIRSYLDDHPEIDIFDLWPPDYAKWNECNREEKASPSARHAFLTERVWQALVESHPDVRLQVIAFAHTLPPNHIHPSVMVDICPIDQHFEKQIYDTTSHLNNQYRQAILDWRELFSGDLGIYTYYRKYAWRSLPNSIPRYMQQDLLWFAGVPVQGISCYAEPGDWLTYELNHYVLSKLEWAPSLCVDSLVSLFCKGRYGRHWQSAMEALQVLEETVRFYGNIRHTPLKVQEAISKAKERLQHMHAHLKSLAGASGDREKHGLDNLLLMLNYALLDLSVQEARASDVAEEVIVKKIEEVVAFLQKHAKTGLVIFNPSTDFNQWRQHYNR